MRCSCCCSSRVISRLMVRCSWRTLRPSESVVSVISSEMVSFWFSLLVIEALNCSSRWLKYWVISSCQDVS